MKVKIDEEGQLTIISETIIEAHALAHVTNKNTCNCCHQLKLDVVFDNSILNKKPIINGERANL